MPELDRERLRRVVRRQLAAHRLDVAEHPKLGDLAVVHREKRRAGPADLTPGGLDAEKFCAVPAAKTHARRGAIVRLDHLLDGADEILQRSVDRPQIGDKADRPAQFGPERSAETKAGAENFVGLGLVRLVPDHMVKTFDQLTRRWRHLFPPHPAASLVRAAPGVFAIWPGVRCSAAAAWRLTSPRQCR